MHHARNAAGGISIDQSQPPGNLPPFDPFDRVVYGSSAIPGASDSMDVNLAKYLTDLSFSEEARTRLKNFEIPLSKHIQLGRFTELDRFILTWQRIALMIAYEIGDPGLVADCESDMAQTILESKSINAMGFENLTKKFTINESTITQKQSFHDEARRGWSLFRGRKGI